MGIPLFFLSFYLLWNGQTNTQVTGSEMTFSGIKRSVNFDSFYYSNDIFFLLTHFASEHFYESHLPGAKLGDTTIPPGNHRLYTIKETSRKKFMILNLNDTVQIPIAISLENLYLMGWVNNHNEFIRFNDPDLLVSLKEIQRAVSTVGIIQTLFSNGGYNSLKAPKNISPRADQGAFMGLYRKTFEEITDAKDKEPTEKTLTKLIFYTSEAIRFNNVKSRVHLSFVNQIAFKYSDYVNTINNWGQLSQQLYKKTNEKVWKQAVSTVVVRAKAKL